MRGRLLDIISGGAVQRQWVYDGIELAGRLVNGQLTEYFRETGRARTARTAREVRNVPLVSIRTKFVTIDEASKEQEYYELMINALAGLEDEMLANEAPRSAIDHVMMALELCVADHRRRFRKEESGNK